MSKEPSGGTISLRKVASNDPTNAYITNKKNENAAIALSAACTVAPSVLYLA